MLIPQTELLLTTHHSSLTTRPPYSQNHVLAGRSQAVIRSKTQAAHPTKVTPERIKDFFASFWVPHAHRLIPACRGQQPPIGTECHVADRVRMTLEGTK